MSNPDDSSMSNLDDSSMSNRDRRNDPDWQPIQYCETPESFEWFDLRLMSSLNDVSGIPTEGKNLIVVVTVNNVLHFRIFDGDGKVVVDTDEKRLVVVDTDEKRLTEQARQI